MVMVSTRDVRGSRKFSTARRFPPRGVASTKLSSKRRFLAGLRQRCSSEGERGDIDRGDIDRGLSMRAGLLSLGSKDRIALFTIIFTALFSIAITKEENNRQLPTIKAPTAGLPQIKSPTDILPPMIRKIAKMMINRIPTNPNYFKEAANQVPEMIPNGGNFAFSCKNIKFNAKDYKMSAECEDERQVYKKVQINLDDCVKDNKGVMTQGHGFKATAKGCTLTNMGKLTCRLTGQSKHGHPFTLDLNIFVRNINGVLECPMPKLEVQKKVAYYWKYGGNFSFTCRNFGILDGKFLQGECLNMHKKVVKTKLDLSDCISNYHGQLTMGRDFQKSTKNCFLDLTGMFSCDTEINFEKSKKSSIDLNLIVTNNNGNLKCLIPEYAERVESNIVKITKNAGNFSFSCKRIELNDNILSAQCENLKNSFVPSILLLGNCVSTTENGKLIPGKGFKGKDCTVTELGMLNCKNTDKFGKAVKAKFDLNMNVKNINGKMIC